MDNLSVYEEIGNIYKNTKTSNTPVISPRHVYQTNRTSSALLDEARIPRLPQSGDG